ncbi:hypothetical protein MTR67_047120 [Solanum verrucosum]|uniref:Uncharacterized protein n=1 Tax=Solanum verrucosum TaxID=315347 RepID=A0AAF0ZYA2_SOLVR|nr:hypothetical protein MTR67_047120 [Solanum verrucosum]
MPRNMKYALACWNRDGNQSGHGERWKIVPSYIWWTIQKKRNQRCFEGISTSNIDLEAKCLLNIFSWSMQAPVTSCEHIFDGVFSLVVVLQR